MSYFDDKEELDHHFALKRMGAKNTSSKKADQKKLLEIGDWCCGSDFGHTWFGQIVGHVSEPKNPKRVVGYAIRYYHERGDDLNQARVSHCVRRIEEVHEGTDDVPRSRLVRSQPW